MGRIGSQVAPSARVVAIPATGTGGGNSQPIDYLVTSTDEHPEVYAEQVAQALRETPGTANVNSSAEKLAPQVDIEFDRERARALGVNIGQAAAAIRAAFGGTLATQFDTSRGTKYVQVLYPRAYQTSLAGGERDTGAHHQRHHRAYRRCGALRRGPFRAADDARQS